MQLNDSGLRVCVVAPNKNGKSHISYSFPSLFASKCSNFQVVLVDDRSMDGSVEYVRDNFPGTKILHNTGKRGFAATVNIGVRHAVEQRAEYVAIANTDIRVPEWLLERAVSVFEQDSEIGVMGFREISGEPGTYVFPASPETVSWEEAEQVVGCLFIVNSVVFSKVGLFDEDYFMYGEDNDFFFRVRKAGYKTVNADIPVWHFGEGSIGKRPLLAAWLGYRNALRFAIKNCSPLGVAHMLAALFYHGCLLQHKKGVDLNQQRLRRFNPFSNLLLITGSFLWNLVHLPLTLKQRFFPPCIAPGPNTAG